MAVFFVENGAKISPAAIFDVIKKGYKYVELLYTENIVSTASSLLSLLLINIASYNIILLLVSLYRPQGLLHAWVM